MAQNHVTGVECEVCGSRINRPLFTSPRLDGPLVKCVVCGLVFVELPDGGPDGMPPPDAAQEMVRLAGRAQELSLVDPVVEEGERPWRESMARERLDDLRRVIGSTSGRGHLLEVGCSTGEFLLAAIEQFEVTGVEADPRTSQICAARGIRCFSGAVAEAGFADASFDLAVLYHVFEHLRSPRHELEELARNVRPDGWLVIETPDVETIWFRLLGRRWRQIIPDHIFFYSPSTLGRLLAESGFRIEEVRHVGKTMSLRLFIDRLGRYSTPLARTLSTISRAFGCEERSLRLDLGDVMRVYARRTRL